MYLCRSQFLPSVFPVFNTLMWLEATAGHHSLRINCVKYLSNRWVLFDVPDTVVLFTFANWSNSLLFLRVVSIVLKIFLTFTIPVHLQETMEATQQPGTATPGIRPLLGEEKKNTKGTKTCIRMFSTWTYEEYREKQNKTKQCNDLRYSKFISDITRKDLLHNANRMITDSPRNNPPKRCKNKRKYLVEAFEVHL